VKNLTDLICVEPKGGLIAGTLVHTDKGLVPIERLKISDQVLSRSENDPEGELSYQRIIETHIFEEKSLRLVRFARHNSQSSKDVFGIIATPNDLFWVEGTGWMRSDNLITGNNVRLGAGTVMVADCGPLLLTDMENLAWVPDFPRIFPIYEDGFLIDLTNGVINSDLSNMLTTIKRNVVTENYRFGSDEENFYKSTVYNITVAETHTYFVNDCGVWIHNKPL
jgi:hypothetical protein